MWITIVKSINKNTGKLCYSQIKVAQADNESKQLFYDRLTYVFPSVPSVRIEEAAKAGWLVMSIDELNGYDHGGHGDQWDFDTIDTIVSQIEGLNLNNE